MADREDGPAEEQPQAFDAKKLEPAKKRKWPGVAGRPTGNSPSSSAQRHDAGPHHPSPSRHSNNHHSQSSAGPTQAPHHSFPSDPAADSSPPRKLKRPGQRARISEAEREHIRQRAVDRERAVDPPPAAAAASSTLPARGVVGGGGFGGSGSERAAIDDVVRAHYNAVPERGRDWRRTDSRIKGLRSMNNWVKSCIIQKFAPDEDYQAYGGGGGGKELLVLDMGCGKGGDLGKWQQAPQHVQLYVGLDPAEVSIEQARERYRSMGGGGGGGGRGGGRGGGFHRRGGGGRPLFEARFQVKDCYAESIADVDIVRQVGFDPNPHGGRQGFDIVSMMFCMHYAFETEQKARRMLQNVAGALKKGGRFIGCIPDSDVIGDRVRQFNERMEEAKRKRAGSKTGEGEGEGGASLHNGTAASQGSEQKKESHSPDQAQGEGGGDDDNDDGEVEEGEAEETAEWGNDIYRVRFPGATPADGIFRPPFGWKYSFFLDEAVDSVPEYVVPWEAFRALAEDYNLELQYRRPFREVWQAECDDPVLGPLSERMGVRARGGGPLLVSPEEMEAAGFYIAFCFYKV